MPVWSIRTADQTTDTFIVEERLINLSFFYYNLKKERTVFLIPEN